MKKLVALLLCLMMVLPMAALAEDNVAITLWTYPIGNWTNAETVDGIIAEFNKIHPEISVTVQYLDYTSGDDQVTTAIEAGTTPDIIMEGPERLVSNWGAAGKMLDLSDLWTEEALADISATSEAVVAACKNAEGKYFEYPLCMTTHCMVIDRAAFEAADALQYINEETRTWTTEGFENALRALTNAGFTPTGIVYCGGQGGDQGTRALVNNLYSGQFTNADHTAYTADSEENIKGLQKLVDLVNEGVLTADPSIVAGDEIALFCNGTAKMSFCWNASAAVSNKASIAEGIDPLPMAFPSDDGVPELCGGIWGFGIFDKGDAAKIEAAKKFIKFMCDSPSTADAVSTSTFFAARTSAEGTDLTKLFDNEMMNDYAALMLPNLGDYYNVIKGWAAARTEWWNMLQEIGNGDDMTETIATHMANANAAAAG